MYTAHSKIRRCIDRGGSQISLIIVQIHSDLFSLDGTRTIFDYMLTLMSKAVILRQSNFSSVVIQKTVWNFDIVLAIGLW